MINNYVEVIKAKFYWGYGKYTYPIINRQISIDNEYFYLAITSGVNNLLIYLAIIFMVLYRLFKFIRLQSFDSPEGRLGWVLLGSLLSAILTQGTVYSGMQTTQYFFMMAAISEALIINNSLFLTEKNKSKNSKIQEEVGYAYNFSRTL